jgi:trans-aconitate methyltransferase
MKLRYLDSLARAQLKKIYGNILEVGCSDGLFTFWARQMWPQANIDAIDIDRDNIDQCARLVQECKISNVRFRLQNALDLDEHNKYDLVLALDVLEHIIDDSVVVSKIFAALRPGGTLIVHVPNVTYTTFSGIVHAVPDEEAYKINEGHVRTGYSSEVLTRLLGNCGFSVDFIGTAHGAWSDLAHQVYCRLEHPAALRLLALPAIDLFSFLDRHLPRHTGNTVFAIATKPSVIH